MPYDNIRNTIRRLTPADNRDLAILAATETAARGRRVTKQELAARYIREGIDRSKVATNERELK